MLRSSVFFHRDQFLEDLHEILEKVDIDQVRESRNSRKRGREQGRGRRVFQNSKIEREEQFQSFRLLEMGGHC